MTHVSLASASTSSAGNLTAEPAGVVAGYALVARMTINNNGSSATPPSGWVLKSSISVGGAGAQTLLVWGKVASGADVFTWTGITGSSFAVLTVSAYSGRDATDPFVVTPVTTNNSSSNASPFTASINGITANANDDVEVVMTRDAVSTDRWVSDAATITGSTFTEVFDSAPVNYVDQAVNVLENYGGGATGTVSIACTRTVGAGATSYCGIVLTLKAAAGGGGAALAGGAISVTSATGTMTTGIPFGGASVALSSANGNLTAQINLNAIALAVAAATGSLTAQIVLNGAALSQALASGNLTAGSSGLSGAAVANASAGGALITQIPLAGNAQAYATAASGLTTIIQLSGVAVSINNATGEITAHITLAGDALATALAAGDLTAKITFNGAALAAAAASGALSNYGAYVPEPARMRHIVGASRVRRLVGRSRIRTVPRLNRIRRVVH